jgi:hypothetical protein
MYGIAAILIGIAACLFGAAAVLRAIGLRVKEPERELTEEEKENIRASTRASESYAKAVERLTVFGNAGGDSL